ncbi:MAG TPA: phage holin family protein [Solirubrobacteraceae bacterium]|nr:phage holin family protein [Solirubrobacteraceae bacterium]
MRQLSDQTTLLARQEVALAKAELAEKGKRAGVGAGMFGGAGLVGAYAVGALVAAAILGLATAVDGWLAAVIVGLVLAAVAGVLALVGKNRVQQATPPLPEEAISNAKQDVDTVKARAQEGRR